MIYYLNANKLTVILLLDFAKEFDKVPHERSCQDLFHYGVRGPLLEWILKGIDLKVYY